MGLIKVFENDNFIIDYDKDNKKYRVSYFEDHHFKEECWFDEYNENINLNLEPLVFPDDIEKWLKEAEKIIKLNM